MNIFLAFLPFGDLLGGGSLFSPQVLDVIILIAIAFGAIGGFSEGGIQKVAGYIGLALGLKIGLEMMDVAGQTVGQYLPISSEIESYVGFLAVFLLVQGIATGLGLLIESVVGIAGLGLVNRLVGAILGGVKNAAIVSLTLLVLSPLGIPSKSTKAQSQIYSSVEGTFPTVYNATADIFTGLPSIHRLSSLPGDLARNHALAQADLAAEISKVAKSTRANQINSGVREALEKGRDLQRSVDTESLKKALR